ncbi:MAG: T9SS type A sorting domain-containing protein [bacterium]|nr:T9SS type A sorting domain-containing protein [candidate division KSB1 bacterium]MDH7561409.1 T9SS type A sorting domain-containing protein [bacterium]
MDVSAITQAYITPVVNNHALHEQFYVDIQVKDAQNLFGVAFKFNFPADKLEALSAEKGDFLGADPVFFPDINNSAGVVSVGISKKSGQPAASGTGIVARIKLKEKPSVTSGITINLSLSEVTANDPSGNPITLTPQNISYVTPNPTSVADRTKQLPEEYVLNPNYPNPFNPTTTISSALPQAGQVLLQIFGTYGRLVKNLVTGHQGAGVHSVDWNAQDEMSIRVASGIYICRLTTGEVVLYRKLILAK